MIRGILDRYLGTLVKYEVKDNVIIEYYSSGKTEVVGLYGLNDMDIEEYIYMLDETINDNASEIDRLEREKVIKEKILIANENLQRCITKQKIKLVAFLGGMTLIPTGFIIGTHIINPCTELMSPSFCGFAIGFLSATIGGTLIINDKKSNKIRQEIESYKTDLKDIEQARKEEKN